MNITALSRYFGLWPVVYMVVSIFLLRGRVEFIYAASAILVMVTALSHWKQDLLSRQVVGRWLVALSAIGLVASMILSIEKVELLSHPQHVTSCSLSPIVACSPIIESWQASAFGLPNSFLGLIGFGLVLAAGMTLLAGAVNLSKWWWRSLLAGLLLATGFSGWLFYQGVFEIGKLCLYCMLVWLTTSTMLWLTMPEALAQEVELKKYADKVRPYTGSLIVVTYLLLFVLIVYRWFDYWVSLLS